MTLVIDFDGAPMDVMFAAASAGSVPSSTTEEHAAQTNNNNNNNVQKPAAPKIRSDFPETWLFIDTKTE
jgi:hypothetical protein